MNGGILKTRQKSAFNARQSLDLRKANINTSLPSQAFLQYTILVERDYDCMEPSANNLPRLFLNDGVSLGRAAQKTCSEGRKVGYSYSCRYPE